MIEIDSVNPLDLPSVPLEQRSQLPETSCIYFAIDGEGVVQYIGQTKNLKRRWKAHDKGVELGAIGGVKISYLDCDTTLLNDIEKALIDWFDPPLNSRLRTHLAVNTDESRIEIRLKQARESKQLSQYELAQRSGMSPQNIQKLEQGRAKGIQLDTLDALCEALDCEIQELLVRVKIGGMT
jgi:DNA-binding Xre family transcriptional regulator